MAGKLRYFYRLAMIPVMIALIAAIFTSVSLWHTAPRSFSDNPIQQENAKPGSYNWQITKPALKGQIEAYTSADSLAPGQSLTLYVSDNSSDAFTIDLYRLGYYGGLGAREVYQAQHVPGIPQGYYQSTNGSPTGSEPGSPTGCRTCTLDATTHEVKANWSANTPLDTITFGSDWVSGVYFIRVTEESTFTQWSLPVVLRDDTANADAIMALPFNTYQAYNYWGGASLYNDFTSSPLAVGHAYQVSYDRPYAEYSGAQFLFMWTYQMVKFMEGEGIDVRYTTDNALDKGYTTLANYKAFVVAGHSEYWSYNMRQALENAIAINKMSVGFFAANDIYWQVRMPDDRTVVCYKDEYPTTINDPYDNGQPDAYLTTTLWRLNPVNKPEDHVLKAMYGRNAESEGTSGGPQQDMDLVNTQTSWAFSNTGIGAGTVVHGILGPETDTAYPTDGSWGPDDNITFLAQSPYKNADGVHWTVYST
ncbi:MAG: N,N-dimethylformamidase beta subunit family domain-containing protein, partial [Ktedonobacterales bacterium]